jgi:hypothetical protein
MLSFTAYLSSSSFLSVTDAASLERDHTFSVVFPASAMQISVPEICIVIVFVDGKRKK